MGNVRFILPDFLCEPKFTNETHKKSEEWLLWGLFREETERAMWDAPHQFAVLFNYNRSCTFVLVTQYFKMKQIRNTVHVAAADICISFFYYPFCIPLAFNKPSTAGANKINHNLSLSWFFSWQSNPYFHSWMFCVTSYPSWILLPQFNNREC